MSRLLYCMNLPQKQLVSPNRLLNFYFMYYIINSEIKSASEDEYEHRK